MNNNLNTPKSLIVWTRFQPTSSDPMDYDLAVHHITMRSIYASLVSTYKSGEIAPQIAKSWSRNNDGSEWTIEIDENWIFENGDKVTSEIVKKSLQRILFLKNKQNSQSGLLEYLIGAHELKSIDDNIPGLTINKSKIIFKFSKPMDDFLEKISFGIYAIVHPSNYDMQSGKWHTPKSIISSGKYRILKWTEDEFALIYRENLLPAQNNDREIKNIIFNFSKDLKEMDNSDLIIKEKLNPSIDKAVWTYASTTEDNNISYIQVMKWNNPKSLLSKKDVRQKLRNIFYRSLNIAGFKVETSFFPLSINGVENFEYEQNDTFNYSNSDFTSQPYFTSASGKELGDIYKNAFDIFGKEINAKVKTADYPQNENDEAKVFDIQFLATGIVIDYPFDDIKFMFLSKQGIKLPDETGEIKKELKNDKFDIQKINTIIWDQAIVWPVRHYSMGFWIKNKSNLDLSELNLTAHPIDFQFLKWKNK